MSFGISSRFSDSTFHLLVNEETGKRRVKVFSQGYEQMLPLPEEEINVLDKFVRLK